LPAGEEKIMLIRAATLCVIAICPFLAAAADWKNELKVSIESTFKFCKLDTGGLSPNFNTVSRPGTPLLIKVEGVDGDIASNASVPVTLIQDCQSHAATGGLSGLLRNEQSTRAFKIGERIYLYDVFIKNDHQLFLNLVSVEKYDVNSVGSTLRVRYKGILRFEFPKNYLLTASFGDVRAAIEAIIAPAPEPENWRNEDGLTRPKS
jgi:hypothetical protein